VIEYFIWGLAVVPIGIITWRYRVYKEEQRRCARGYRYRRAVRYDVPDRTFSETPERAEK
jgi:hypothetical protein